MLKAFFSPQLHILDLYGPKSIQTEQTRVTVFAKCIIASGYKIYSQNLKKCSENIQKTLAVSSCVKEGGLKRIQNTQSQMDF